MDFVAFRFKPRALILTFDMRIQRAFRHAIFPQFRQIFFEIFSVSFWDNEIGEHPFPLQTPAVRPVKPRRSQIKRSASQSKNLSKNIASCLNNGFAKSRHADDYSAMMVL